MTPNRKFMPKIGSLYQSFFSNTKGFLNISEAENQIHEPDSSFISNKTFWILLLCITLVRLWITNGKQIIVFGNAGFDDYLFVRNAYNFLHLDWLGSYDQYTLIKGPFYSFFIAASFLSSLPLLLVEQIFFVFCCLVFIWAISPIIHQKFWLVVFYTLVLFTPISYSILLVNRVFRDFVYTSLTLLVLSCCFGIFIRKQEKLRKLLPWTIGLGFSLFAFWTIREEGIWIIPAVILLLGGCLLDLFFRRPPTLKRRLFVLGMPFFIWLGGVFLLSLINGITYGEFAVTEMTDKTFKTAFGSLTRVKTTSWYPDVPVTYEARQKIYQISPAMKELENYLEGEPGKAWSEYGGNKYQNAPGNEILGGWYVWAFREAVASAGHYGEGKFPSEYYERLTDEIDQACVSGQLDCYPARASINQPLDIRHAPFFFESLKKGFLYLTTNKEFYISTKGSSYGESNYWIFEDLSNQRVENSYFRLSGWALYDNQPVSLSILDRKERPFNDTRIEQIQRPDVRNLFANKGFDNQEIIDSGFFVETSCLNNCYLEIKQENEVRVLIPLNDITRSNSFSRDSLLSFNVEYVHSPALLYRPTYDRLNKIKIAVLDNIGKLYSTISPAASIFAFITSLVMVFYYLKAKRFGSLTLVICVIWLEIIIRVILLVLIDAIAFSTTYVGYYSPAFLLLAVVQVLTVIGFSKLLNDFLVKRNVSMTKSG